MKTDYPDDTVLFPLTLEELSILSMQYPGAGWDDMVLRAKQMLAEKQTEISARKLSQQE